MAKFTPGDRKVAYTPEAQYLLHCLRTFNRKDDAHDAPPIPPDGLDWGALLRHAYRHSVMPLVYWALRDKAIEYVPMPVMEYLLESYRVNARRNRLLSRELLRLVRLLEGKGIEVIPYKGPEMAARLYEDAGLREFKDLDLLVRMTDIDKVCGLLIDDGYRDKVQMDSRRRSLQIRQYKEYGFIRRGLPHHPGPLPDFRPRENPNYGCMIVEPHWSFTARRFSFPLDYSALFDRARRVSFDGAELSSLSVEELLLVLCVNGAKSAWARLLLVCDVAAMVRSEPELDYERCLGLAAGLGCERIVLLGLLLAHECCAAPLPAQVLARARGDEAAVDLAVTLSERIFDDPASDGLVRKRFFSPVILRMRERNWDKLCYLFQSLTEPGELHLQYFPLPSVLFPLYRIIVPLCDFIVLPTFRLLRPANPLKGG